MTCKPGSCGVNQRCQRKTKKCLKIKKNRTNKN